MVVLHFSIELFGKFGGLIKRQITQNTPLSLRAASQTWNNNSDFSSINEKVLCKHHHRPKKYQVIPVVLSLSLKLCTPLLEKHLHLI